MYSKKAKFIASYNAKGKARFLTQNMVLQMTLIASQKSTSPKLALTSLLQAKLQNDKFSSSNITRSCVKIQEIDTAPYCFIKFTSLLFSILIFSLCDFPKQCLIIIVIKLFQRSIHRNSSSFFCYSTTTNLLHDYFGYAHHQC